MRSSDFSRSKVALCVCLIAVGCADGAQQIRKVTYPRDFHYITRGEITGAMMAFGLNIDLLDEIMSQENGVQEGDRDRVIQILTEMRTLSQQLKKGGRSNHPRIDRAAPWLERDLQRALVGARASPPNYFYAGEVSGACEYCHVPRHESARPPQASIEGAGPQ